MVPKRIRNAMFFMMLLAGLLSCGCKVGVKITSYGNVNFVGSGNCDRMFIDGAASNIELTLLDGRKISLASISRKQVSELFGKPVLAGKIELGATEYEEFGTDNCTFVFKNGDFASVEVSEGVKVANQSNGRSLTLPATEANVRAVFGEPTSVTYVKSQQP
jgi:hypothetical protein